MGLETKCFCTIFFHAPLLILITISLSKSNSFADCDDDIEKEYDFVVVGAGSAGSVVASRLSELSCISVLLLEAGGEPPQITEVPAFFRRLLRTDIDWQYKTAPQKYAAYSKKDRISTWSAGKVLGGSSTINGMMYVRGNHKNYDDWEALGARGWNYWNIRPYFLKLEDNHNINDLDEGYHSTGGPIGVEKPVYESEIKQPLLRALKDMGYEVVDSNGERQTGIYDVQGTTRHHKRDSSYTAYLGPEVRSRSNLKILTHAYATKILIAKKQAYGVEFDRGNVRYQVRAKKEVIISTGTVRTPQILMLSGIGPEDQLKKFNIDIVANLPVGKNLQDHFQGSLVYTLDDSVTPLSEKLEDPFNEWQYYERESGPLTSPACVSLTAFLRGINTTSQTPDFPRNQIDMAETTHFITKPSRMRQTGEENTLKIAKPAYICASVLIQPESRGEITLNSKDPYDMPYIDPNYFEVSRDLEVVVEGMKICHALSKQPAMEKLKPKLVRWKIPECERYYRWSITDYFTCLAKHDGDAYYHNVGTAKMGEPCDPNSVVDPELRVIGVKGLRIVSAAVMPLVTSGNTHVPTLMIAEKASDMIKQNIEC